MDEGVGVSFAGPRRACRLAAFTVALALVIVLVIGALALTMEWNALSCFDGDEPGCADGNDGLEDIQSATWLLAGGAIGALAATTITSWRLRRPAQVVASAALCAGAAVLVAMLYWRLLALLL